ncbi:hypothetical protein Pla8534_70920 [Lignipirellula cremea]|uniref:Uncharacterized protein n=1 Tax=Lignipirellula cremea TaxID=2528010 RepID=A0A518E517_9BACT|nr:hypothetical protein Pla8534_70920 [Lignipirellula cremea]
MKWESASFARSKCTIPGAPRPLAGDDAWKREGWPKNSRGETERSPLQNDSCLKHRQPLRRMRQRTRANLSLSVECEQLEHKRSDKSFRCKLQVREPGRSQAGLVASTATTTAAAAATVAAAASTTITAATAAATTSTAAATATIFARTRFVDAQRTTFMLGLVQAGDGRLSFGVARHFDESETFALSRVAIGDNLSTLNRAKLAKELFQV